MFCDPALAAVDPLGERLFLAVPARAGVVRGSRRAVCHAGSAFTVRLRARNSPSTALYTRVPVKNRVRISRALRRIRAQRPRPHMGGRALGTLARPRLATDWLRQPSARCRFDAIPITHLHTATVEAHTDNLGARAAARRPYRLHGAPRHWPLCPRPHARTPLVPVPLRRLVRRRPTRH